jgi:hypothetical protein
MGSAATGFTEKATTQNQWSDMPENSFTRADEADDSSQDSDIDELAQVLMNDRMKTTRGSLPNQTFAERMKQRSYYQDARAQFLGNANGRQTGNDHTRRPSTTIYFEPDASVGSGASVAASAGSDTQNSIIGASPLANWTDGGKQNPEVIHRPPTRELPTSSSYDNLKETDEDEPVITHPDSPVDRSCNMGLTFDTEQLSKTFTQETEQLSKKVFAMFGNKNRENDSLPLEPSDLAGPSLQPMSQPQCVPTLSISDTTTAIVSNLGWRSKENSIAVQSATLEGAPLESEPRSSRPVEKTFSFKDSISDWRANDNTATHKAVHTTKRHATEPSMEIKSDHLNRSVGEKTGDASSRFCARSSHQPEEPSSEGEIGTIGTSARRNHPSSSSGLEEVTRSEWMDIVQLKDSFERLRTTNSKQEVEIKLLKMSVESLQREKTELVEGEVDHIQTISILKDEIECLSKLRSRGSEEEWERLHLENELFARQIIESEAAVHEWRKTAEHAKAELLLLRNELHSYRAREEERKHAINSPSFEAGIEALVDVKMQLRSLESKVIHLEGERASVSKALDADRAQRENELIDIRSMILTSTSFQNAVGDTSRASVIPEAAPPAPVSDVPRRLARSKHPWNGLCDCLHFTSTNDEAFTADKPADTAPNAT